MSEFFNIGSLVIQFINIIIIIYLLNRFLFKPYLKYLDNESKQREELEWKLSNVDSIVKNAELEANSIIDNAKEKASWIKKEAIASWKNEWESIKNQAKTEAEKILNKWLLDIEEERKTLHASFKKEATSLVIKLNQKLFDKSEVSDDFINKSVSNMAK